MTDLKPCPYCGSGADFKFDPDFGLYCVCCFECGMNSPFVEEREEAAAMWDETVDAVNAYRLTCTVKHQREKSDCILTVLSCGHEFVDFDERVPKYCPECGAKVVNE